MELNNAGAQWDAAQARTLLNAKVCSWSTTGQSLGLFQLPNTLSYLDPFRYHSRLAFRYCQGNDRVSYTHVAGGGVHGGSRCGGGFTHAHSRRRAHGGFRCGGGFPRVLSNYTSAARHNARARQYKPAIACAGLGCCQTCRLGCCPSSPRTGPTRRPRTACIWKRPGPPAGRALRAFGSVHRACMRWAAAPTGQGVDWARCGLGKVCTPAAAAAAGSIAGDVAVALDVPVVEVAAVAAAVAAGDVVVATRPGLPPLQRRLAAPPAHAATPPRRPLGAARRRHRHRPQVGAPP
eukprot:352565-Chlamydomonas_euryale.AAC.2